MTKKKALDAPLPGGKVKPKLTPEFNRLVERRAHRILGGIRNGSCCRMIDWWPAENGAIKCIFGDEDREFKVTIPRNQYSFK